MHRVSRYLAFFSVLLVVLFLFGCGRNPLGRQEVTGAITLDGQPLDQGLIQFEPKQRGEGRVGSGTSIKDGRYAIPTLKGIPPGEYLVRIHSAVERGGAPAEGEMPGVGGGGIGVERIPPKYNVRTELSATLTEDGPNTFDFDLKSR